MITAKRLIQFLTAIREFCQTHPFNVYGDAMRDEELVSHLFLNSVTSNPVHCYLRCIHDCRCLSLKLQGKERHEIMRLEQRQAISLTSQISLKCSPRCRNYNLRTVYHRELGKFSCVFLSIHFNFELVLMISTLFRACSLFS